MKVDEGRGASTTTFPKGLAKEFIKIWDGGGGSLYSPRPGRKAAVAAFDGRLELVHKRVVGV